ncbi:MAG: methyltransferase domain-containing protein [Pseudonocardia sp.]
MAQLEFDDDAARRIDRTYATPDVVEQRARTLALLDAQPGERVLDVGSGPGYLAASVADLVGASGAVHGLDPSAPMNALASARLADRPWASIDTGDALALPYPDGFFDAAVSTQVYEYVADLDAAFAELRRVVRLGGRVLVLDTDWDTAVWNLADRARHARVMAAWEEHLAHPRLPRVLGGLLRRAGFEVTGQHVIPLLNTELREDTYSAQIATLVADFVAGRQGLTAADAGAWLADLRDPPGGYFFTINRHCVTAVAR